MNRCEDAGFVAAEIIIENQIEGLARLRLVFVVPMGVVPAAVVEDFFRRQAEEKEILLAGLLGHLDGGAVAGADRQRAVHHELHVAGAAGLVAPVEIWLETSLAGMRCSATVTQ